MCYAKENFVAENIVPNLRNQLSQTSNKSNKEQRSAISINV